MPTVHYTELRNRLQRSQLVTGASSGTGPVIRHVTCDSRTAGPGSCFVAIRGTQVDGLAFVDQAIARGAVLVVSESASPREAVAHVQVTSARAALALCAAALYGDPAEQLTCFGITGTNGKTTTAWLLHHVLTGLGETSGLLGTVAYAYGNACTEASLTTPGPPELHRMLGEMVAIGCRWCVMEVSSHALDQRRVHGIPFGVGVFTNLKHDHLDYHKTRAAYANAKKRLFDELGPHAVAVYNTDDAAGPKMVHDTEATKVAYGQHPHADMRFEVLGDTAKGLRLCLDGQALTTRLSGTFNAYNVAAAYAAACAQGLPVADVLAVLATVPPVPGRFEPFRFDDGALAIVDYAHTPDALEQALVTARHCFPQAALWCLFGCGGDRDKAKRPLMGAVAERLADHVIVTSDNTRSESYRAISEDIEQGMKRPREVLWIEDRREAIGHAAQRAGAGDVVLIAGKGHETFQVIGSEAHPLSDRQLVLEAFAQRVHIN